MSETAEPAVTEECDWPITNCYVDAWMLILAHRGFDPVAGLGVTLAQDYEADQFTFFKYLHGDLELLYGLIVGELAIYSSLEEQIEIQVRRGRLVLVEVDSYYLPDTRATSYLQQHTKTTIGIDRINVDEQRLWYFHNVGHYELSGIDYAGVLRRLGEQADDVLPPYVEFIKPHAAGLTGSALTEAAVELLRRHLGRRPADNPVRRYRDDFPQHMERLISRPQFFHDYAFGTFRQLGANYELLARHLLWLQQRGTAELGEAVDAARAMSTTAKSMQFKVARIAARRQFDSCAAMFDSLERNYEMVGAAVRRAVARSRMIHATHHS